jgi:hypothetical protein
MDKMSLQIDVSSASTCAEWGGGAGTPVQFSSCFPLTRMPSGLEFGVFGG